MIGTNSIIKKNMKKFSVYEDATIINLVAKYGMCSWSRFVEYVPGRTEKQIRERYLNYLQPGISVEPWSRADDELLIQKVHEFGTKWKTISQFFPYRTHNNIKNRWYIHLRSVYYTRFSDSLKCKQKKTYHKKKSTQAQEQKNDKLEAEQNVTPKENSQKNETAKVLRLENLISNDGIYRFCEMFPCDLYWENLDTQKTILL